MNLTGSGLVSHNVGNLLAVVLPFSVSWMFYQGDAILQLLSWGGIIFTSLVAFVLPLLIALHAIDTSDEEGSVVVYGSWKLTSKKSRKIVLRLLLVLAGLAISAAILGHVFNEEMIAFLLSDK
jgi:hypothetical protein